MAVKIAAWKHSLPTSADGVRTLIRRLKDAGIDLFIPCVKQVDGRVDYPSQVADVHEPYQGWDALMVAAEEANTVGLALHAWCCVFAEGKHSRLLAEHPDCVAVQDGTSTEDHQFACPRRPETQAYELAIYQELIDRYPVQGVHLDYIRYSSGYCVCPACVQSYRETTGKDLRQHHLNEWQHAETHDMDAWIAWRCAPVTEFVRTVRAAATAGGKELSAAVFHYLPGQLQDVGQDWELWARDGLLDYVMPMNYSKSTRIAAEWTRNNVAALAGSTSGCRLWEGIVRPSHMTTPRFLEHIRAVAGAGVEGVCIFEVGYLTDEDMQMLSSV